MAILIQIKLTILKSVSFELPKLGYYRNNIAPRFLVFAYDGWKTIDTLYNNFHTFSLVHKDAHIHGVCNLLKEGSLYVRHNAYKEGDERFFKSDVGGFRQFLTSLPTMIELMLPNDRIGFGFDQIDRGHYEF